MREYMNLQKSGYWAAETPHVLQEHPLRYTKGSVWCELSARRIVAQIFFYARINSEIYGRIFILFVEQLNQEIKLANCSKMVKHATISNALMLLLTCSLKISLF